MDDNLISNLVDSFKSISLDVEVISCSTVGNGNRHEESNGNLITVFNVGDGTDNLQMHFYGWFNYYSSLLLLRRGVSLFHFKPIFSCQKATLETAFYVYVSLNLHFDSVAIFLLRSF